MGIGITIHSLSPCKNRPLAPPSVKRIAAAAIMLSAAVNAAEWTVVPGVELRETYTDNVNLQSGALAKSDYVSEITPSIFIMTKGPYLKVDANCSVQELEYAEKNAPATFLSQLHADLNAKLIDNLLYFDGMASANQQNISALGAQPTDNIYVTDNRTNVRAYNASPYLSHAFDAFATSELRYTFNSVAANTGGLLTSKTDTTSLKVNSGTAFEMLGWGAQYSDQVIHYPAIAAVNLESVSGNLSYLIDPEFKLTATAGYDNNNYAALGGQTKGYFWSGGFAWTASERTSLSATAGHRYYGDTYSLNASTRSRATIWNLSYNESITTLPSQFGLPATIDTAGYLSQLLSGTISDPAQRGQAVNNIIQNAGLPSSLANPSNYFTNSVFLQKQLQASMAANSPKTTLVISFFDTVRDPLSSQQDAGILVGNQKTKQLGGSAILSRRLSPQTSATVTLLATRVDSVAIGDVESTQMLKFGLTKQLARKLKGTLEIRRDKAESSQLGTEYRENAIAAFVYIQL